MFKHDGKQNIDNLTALYSRVSPELSSDIDATLRFIPLSFVRSGYYNYYKVVLERGINGYYWSPRTYNPALAYRLFFSNSSINFRNTAEKALGLPLRCVAR